LRLNNVKARKSDFEKLEEIFGVGIDPEDMTALNLQLEKMKVEGSYKTLYAMNETGMFNPKLTKDKMMESAIKICGFSPEYKEKPKNYKMNKGNTQNNRLSSVDED